MSANARRGIVEIKVALRKRSSRRPSVSLQIEDLQGDLAEQLLQENGSELVSRAATMEPIAVARLVAVDDNVTDELFDWAVAGQPHNASTVIQFASASAGKMASFRASAPALQARVPLERAVRLTPHLVRRHTAEALYRRVKTLGS